MVTTVNHVELLWLFVVPVRRECDKVTTLEHNWETETVLSPYNRKYLNKDLHGIFLMKAADLKGQKITFERKKLI